MSLNKLTKNNFADWDPDLLYWYKDSRRLATSYYKNFDIWFSKERFNYDESEFLAKNCSSHFPKWWITEKFNWRKGSHNLAKYCREHIDLWIDTKHRKELMPPKYLLEYCSEHFEKWWKPKYLNYDDDNIIMMVRKCSQHFEKWYKKSVFSQMVGRRQGVNDGCICKEREYFWDQSGKKKPKCICGTKDLGRCNLKDYFEAYCNEYKHIWEPDFIICNLKGT